MSEHAGPICFACGFELTAVFERRAVFGLEGQRVILLCDVCRRLEKLGVIDAHVRRTLP